MESVLGGPCPPPPPRFETKAPYEKCSVVEVPRKIVQISTASASVASEISPGIAVITHIAALCNDGTVWGIYDSEEGWLQLPFIPQPEASK